MKAKLRSWWQKNKQLLIIATVILALLLVFALAVYRFGWDWTGFIGGPSKITKTPQGTTTDYSPEKNLWDWLQLLLVPIMLAIGGFWLNRIQKDREEKAAKEQERLERESREDSQREAAIQGYIDKMSELLLEKKLHQSELDDAVREVARVRTLTVVYSLDGIRKGRVVQFIYESGLIYKDQPVIDLHKTQLRDIVLSFENLANIDLHEARMYKAVMNGIDLSEANLSGAYLSEASLLTAILRGANLSEAKLSRAALLRANLSGADLSGANLSEAHLYGADLSGADLSKAKVTMGQLRMAKSLKGATMPDGTEHP